MASISIFNRQRGHSLDTRLLRSLLPIAAQAIAASPPGPEPDLWENLPVIEAFLVSDKTIARFHAQFLSDPTPTDVITFHHGEILISVDTAACEASTRKLPLEREILLYLVHGCLHLRGFDDHNPINRKVMHRVQNRIVSSLWKCA